MTYTQKNFCFKVKTRANSHLLKVEFDGQKNCRTGTNGPTIFIRPILMSMGLMREQRPLTKNRYLSTKTHLFVFCLPCTTSSLRFLHFCAWGFPSPLFPSSRFAFTLIYNPFGVRKSVKKGTTKVLRKKKCTKKILPLHFSREISLLFRGSKNCSKVPWELPKEKKAPFWSNVHEYDSVGR